MTIPVFLHQPPFLGLSPLSSKKFRTPPPSTPPKWLNFWKVLPHFNNGGKGGGGGGGCSNYVSIVNTCSDEASIICGMPQFSTLGPLLFLICISHMPKAVDSELLLYANDTCLVFQHKDGLFQKKSKQGRGGWGYTFLKSPPGHFRFVTLPHEILEKKSFYPWKFCKFVWHPLEIPKSKTKTHRNSALVFLEHPWNFHFFFNWPMEFPCFFSWIINWYSRIMNWAYFWCGQNKIDSLFSKTYIKINRTNRYLWQGCQN